MREVAPFSQGKGLERLSGDQEQAALPPCGGAWVLTGDLGGHRTCYNLYMIQRPQVMAAAGV